MFGVVKTVSGGRVLVDFNHPLAGKDLVYNVKINKIVDDIKEKLNSLLKMHLNIKDAEIELKEESNASERSETRSQLTASINLKQELPNQAQEEFKKVVERIIPAIKNVVFTIPQEKNK